MARKKVLVVDDEPAIVKLVSVKLSKEGFDVIEAYDGEEALQRIADSKPDMIILDIMMPKFNGWGVHKVLTEKSEYKNIPIVALTAMCHYEKRIKGDPRIAAYIPKPFHPGEVAEVVKKILGSPELEED